MRSFYHTRKIVHPVRSGSRSKRGTEIASTFYSLLETAKLAAVDPAKYLAAAAIAGDDKVALLPSNFS
jgi:hypothetical protein